jgi:hypothetical protein
MVHFAWNLTRKKYDLNDIIGLAQFVVAKSIIYYFPLTQVYLPTRKINKNRIGL